jgi:hypothetical protein
MADEKLLRIYLADHLAGANAGRAVAKRCLASNRGSALGNYLENDLLPAIESDMQTLQRVMDVLRAPRNPVKNTAARLTVHVGRLKLNGRLTGYSPLSRLEEVEGLCLGVQGKESLWRSLRSVSSAHPLTGFDFDELIERARRQREDLEQHRMEAALVAFAAGKTT